MSENTKIVEQLLELPDLDANIRTNDDKCALQLALMPPYTNGPPFSLAAKLIEKGARSNQNNEESGDSILQLLIKSKLEDSAIFLSQHANVNFVNREGLTALHLACQYNMAKLVRALLENGASPNMQSGIGEMKSALHYAVENKSVDAIRVLVEFKENATDDAEKPDFNLKTVDGDSPLSLALMLEAKELVPILIEGGSDVNARNGQDLTLLHQSILKEDADTAKFLLDQGILKFIFYRRINNFQIVFAIDRSVQKTIFRQNFRVVSTLLNSGGFENFMISANSITKFFFSIR